MAAVTSTASLCPAAGGLSPSSPSFTRKPSSSHRRRLQAATTFCRCRPARVEGLDRREALLSIVLAAAAPALAPGCALADEATVWSTGKSCRRATLPTRMRPTSSALRFHKAPLCVCVCAGWLIGAGEVSGIKSVTAFYPEQAADSNVSVAITGIGPDFTSLKSFGDVDAFAEGLVNGLDRSWQRPPGLAAKLIDSRAANGLYYVEYTLQNPGERRRHILSAIGMAFNGWYNRLYTVTGQYIDDGDSEKYRPQIEKAVKSFRLVT
ncbi:PsbP domain-containing protein 3, chloroplastic [Dichanthelium oligosanthes]|uniref:PsbP domain-containing protein 3, chloroplastic n=1 Tax=Dichanthelium oligosanthes TaxID=888268 RepID=A0A1E5VCP2_9POAL|nr:PsbP domain-containing protein 3, chloroplastic [Dichanthelium oligosanthes]